MESKMMSRYGLGGPPHPVIVTIGDGNNHMKDLLLCHYYRVGGPPKGSSIPLKCKGIGPDAT